MPEKRNCAAPQGWIAATTRNPHWKPGDCDERTAPGRLNATALPTPAALQGAFDALTLTIVQLVWRVTKNDVVRYSVSLLGGFADVSLFDESPHGCPPPGGGCPEGAGGERDPRKPRPLEAALRQRGSSRSRMRSAARSAILAIARWKNSSIVRF